MQGDESEALEAVTKGAVSGALAPFGDLLVRLLGGACDEIGKGLTAGVAGWSLKRQIRFWQEAARMISDAGFDSRSVSPKLLITIVQNASIEDDDEMQDCWAALLANAADPRQKQDKRFIHISILKELSAIEARFLSTLYDDVTEGIAAGTRSAGTQGFGWEIQPDFVYRQSWQEDYFDLSLIDNLERLNLIRRSTRQTVVPSADGFIEINVPGTIEQTSFYFTELAFFLVEACTPPTAES